MASLANWDFFNRNVQSGLLEGRFLNAAFTLVAAGAPRLNAIESSEGSIGNIAYPVGILQSVGLGQSSQIMRVWEIGSQRSYFIRGRTAGQMALGRIMYHGPSLLRVLYAYAQGETRGGDALFEALFGDGTAQTKLNLGAPRGGSGGKGAKFEVPPGYENLWINLASDVFDQPIGLLIILRDSNNNTYGAFYVEYCMVQNHNFQTDAGGTILAENVSLVYERIEPVDVNAVTIIANSTDIAGIVGGEVIGSAA
jgi:hypothetical protein